VEVRPSWTGQLNAKHIGEALDLIKRTQCRENDAGTGEIRIASIRNRYSVPCLSTGGEATVQGYLHAWLAWPSLLVRDRSGESKAIEYKHSSGLTGYN